MNDKTNLLIGIFSNRNAAEEALGSLESEGFRPQDVSIIMKDSTRSRYKDEGSENVVKGAAGGVTAGGVLGGLTGLLVGIGAIAVPGIGGLLVGGPIGAIFGLTGAAATTLTGAVTGALAGGLVGSLIGLGIPEHEAKAYQDRIKDGGILLAVPVLSQDEITVRSLLIKHGADMIRVIHTPFESVSQTHTFEDIPAQRTYPEERTQPQQPVYQEIQPKKPAYQTEEVITPRSQRPVSDDTEPIYYSDVRREPLYDDDYEPTPTNTFTTTAPKPTFAERFKQKLKNIFS